MTTATVMESFVIDFLNLIEARLNIMFCHTGKKTFKKTEKHREPIFHLA